jgi:P27 family predicted phage terminase small subunit
VRGRKPKPTYLKLITGNPGGRPLNLDEPEPDGDLRDPPAWFSPRQRILWDQTIRAAPPGLLRVLDSTLLEVYIVAKSLHEKAAMNIEKYGAIVKVPDARGHMASPYMRVLNQQALLMTKCISEMGFSPSSRTRVKVVGNKKPSSALGKLKALKMD